MPRIRYTAWDGTQRIRLDPERVFEHLAEALSEMDDVEQALDWLLRHGFEVDGVAVVGLEDLLAQLREQIRRRERGVSFDRALDEPADRLAEILAREREALADMSRSPEGATLAREKRAFLDDLPEGLSEALERLGRDYRFEEAEAARALEALLERLEDIRRIEDFLRREGHRFRGEHALGFDEAAALLRELDRLRELEQALARGDPTAIPRDRLGEILGQEAVGHLERLIEARLLLERAGYLFRPGGRLRLSAQGIRRIGQLALRDIYQSLLRDRPGGHETRERGLREPRPERTRRYQPGEPLRVALVPTLMRAVRRRPRSPVAIEPSDFEVQETDAATTSSTVLLLDMSWSMSWEGRFAAAKKVALALESLIRTRYPRDYFGVVGFFTRAVELKAGDLPEATWNMGDPFTNLQDALRLAGELLRRHPNRNQQVIVITDGQPTAYFAAGRLHCEWPLSFGGVSLRAAAETLREVERITRRGVTINTFMLDDSIGLRAFVERMTRINRGRALYSRPDRLGEYLLVDYVAKKRRKV